MEQPDIAAMNEISAPRESLRYGGGGFSMEDF